MTNDQPHADIHDRIREQKAKASARKLVDDDTLVLYWLEFSNPDDGMWLGACVVPAPADDFISAVQVAHGLRCNPGGQIAWIEKTHLERLPRRLLARLLSSDEAAEAEAIIQGILQ